MELYLNGASYQEISSRVGIKKVIVLYFSNRFNWYDLKMQMLESILLTLSEKTEIAHTRSIDLLTDLMASLEFYYRETINNYRKSKDRRIIESADMENLKLYMKCMEQIQKYRVPASLSEDKNKPLIGLSLPNGGTFKKIDDNTIEVSNNNSQAMEAQLSKVLSTLAELRRERENKK
jgi:hypothetical protein